MSDARDRELGMDRRISRRDFINGVAVTAGAAMLLPKWLGGEEAGSEPYPPALTGLRGSTDGTYETAHHLRDGDFWEKAGAPIDTGETYDLVIVGAGLSGLSAAWFYRKAAGPGARILLLDNHDDFGGHARRQEFTVDKNFLLTYGGTYAIESPAPYSKVAKGLIEELGIDVPSFPKHLKRERYLAYGLAAGFFFNKAAFGVNRLVPDPLSERFVGAAEVSRKAWDRFMKEAPLSVAAKKDLYRFCHEKTDYMPGLSSAEKKSKLARISYADFVTTVAKCNPAILPVFQARPHPLYGAGIDVVPAQDAWGLGFPGFDGMNLSPEPGIGMNRDSIPDEEAEKYFFHFPDGNAAIARLLVRKLIPAAVPGTTVDDNVLAHTHYGQLDQAASAARIRLSSTVVRVKPQEKQVEVSYVRDGKLATVRGSQCILACWHSVIPYICPDLPADQQTALASAAKVPIVYARAAIRNWNAWVKSGVQSVYAPGNYYTSLSLDMPLSIGGYGTAADPEDPVVATLFCSPCSPGRPAREQHRIGRQELLETPFATMERTLRAEMAAVLGPGGFDPAHDITAIAIHRWPHGYAYQYNSLFDDFWLKGEEGPCALARKPFGRIAIANADAAAYAYTDAAIDHGYRAVQELLNT